MDQGEPKWVRERGGDKREEDSEQQNFSTRVLPSSFSSLSASSPSERRRRVSSSSSHGDEGGKDGLGYVWAHVRSRVYMEVCMWISLVSISDICICIPPVPASLPAMCLFYFFSLCFFLHGFLVVALLCRCWTLLFRWSYTQPPPVCLEHWTTPHLLLREEAPHVSCPYRCVAYMGVRTYIYVYPYMRTPHTFRWQV